MIRTRRLRAALAAAIAAATLAGPCTAAAAEPAWRHGTALVGEPRYPEGFSHFDYVDPAAPKGGTARLTGLSRTFDTLNPVLPKGVAPDGLGLVYETLMTPSLDELDTSASYGLLAEAMAYPDDFGSVTYRLNPAARWHDGTPVAAEDVVWSFEKTVELDPQQRFYYQHVVKAEVTGEREVTFTFDETGNRELPHILGQLTVLPKHWWEGSRPDGTRRDIAAGTLEPPMGSGPYKVASLSPGRSIVYERVPDYWGAALPVNVGKNNFDRLSYEFYLDRDVEFEAFKADKFDYWSENQASRWANGYDFPAVRDGRVVKEEILQDQVSGVMVGFIPNVRRAKLKDARVRRALNYAFDFEDLNRTLFFGQYKRIDSFFFGIPLAASGLPEGRELEILESVRDQVPPSVFTTPYTNPVGGDPQKQRANLREAVRLFQEAGYSLKGNTMVGPDGQPFTLELMLNGPIIERVALPYQAALRKIGVALTIRTVDSNQFTERVYARDFDLVYTGWGQSMSPGNEQLDYWGSKAADQDRSRNYAGIKDPAVDALIQHVVFAKDRDELVAATKALDRVLMANQYVIPSYTSLSDRIAYWNRFGRPDPLPRFVIGFPTVWWWDAAKAETTGGSR